MPERGEFGPEVEEVEDQGTIDETLDQFREEFDIIYENESNGIALDSILTSAETSHEKDPKEWDQLLTNLRDELSPIEDEDEIGQILDRYKNLAKSLS